MNKQILLPLILMLTISIRIFAQHHKLGEYLNFDGVPAFIFYVDETGEHGLAMSMCAQSPNTQKRIGKATEKYIQKHDLTQEEQAKLHEDMPVLATLDIKNYHKAGMLKPKTKKALFEELIPQLSGSGKKNAEVIETYCQQKELSMQDNFPWQYWAKQLGEGWFIPGDEELKKYAAFFCGGLNKEHGINTIKWTSNCKNVSDNVQAQSTIALISIRGLMSSTAKHSDCGFRALVHISNINKSWFELLDNVNGSTKELTAQTCAVHEF